jgi:hypothetical protein
VAGRGAPFVAMTYFLGSLKVAITLAYVAR